jgi:YqaJ-like viral recombinase domain
VGSAIAIAGKRWDCRFGCPTYQFELLDQSDRGGTAASTLALKSELGRLDRRRGFSRLLIAIAASEPPLASRPDAAESSASVVPRGTEALMSDNKRRAFIGGSDARIIMGDDEAALVRLWREKRGEAEPDDLSGTLIVQLGIATEDLNRRWYEHNTGHLVKDVQRRLVHPIHTWMAATLDGVVDPDGGVFEAKFMLPWNFSEEDAVQKYTSPNRGFTRHIVGISARRERCDPRLPLPARGKAAVPASLPLDRERDRVLGQPLHPTPRDVGLLAHTRLRHPRHREGRTAGVSAAPPGVAATAVQSLNDAIRHGAQLIRNG